MLSDRRAGARFPMRAQLTYTLFRGANVIEGGAGEVLNMSSGGLLFRPAAALVPGERIKAAIAWPASLEGVGLQLCVSGSVVRSDADGVAVKLANHEFRTRRAPEAPAERPRLLRLA